MPIGGVKNVTETLKFCRGYCYNAHKHYLFLFVDRLEARVIRALRKVLFILLVASLGVGVSGHALAQSPSWELRINQLNTVENPDAMVTKVYFNIYDNRTGTPMLTVDAQSAQLTLLNTNYTVNGELKKPDIPIYITLVLDASGSMSGAAPALQKAAKESLTNSPDNSLFSVVQFNEDIKLIQDFTQNIPAVSYAIDQYKVANKGTCLYDATYSAVEAMAKAPIGRRAVILFTDGKDEKADGSVCSKHTYQELADLAMQNQVPVSTIGLSYKAGAINDVELKSLAASTGGVSAVAGQNDLEAAFTNMMQALKAQLMFEANIYPRRGKNDAVLNITLKDGTSLSQAFPINSNTDYPGPPSPVSVNFAGLLLKAAQQSYEVQLDMTSPELAKYVKIEIWDKQAGSKVGEYTFDKLAANNQFLIPTEALTIGKSYQMRITAINKQDGTPFAIGHDDQGKPLNELIHEFLFDPSTAYPSLQVQSVVEKSGNLILAVNVTNPDLIGGFDGWLVNEDTNTQVLNSNFTAPAITTTSGNITVPTKSSRIPDGKYTVIVRVLAKNNNVYSTASYEGVTYKAPTLFERLGVALIAAPIFLFGILVIIVAVVGFLMWNSSRQKSLSGMPVLQGRLGGKLSGGSTGSAIPVADEEPIPSRNKPTATPPVKPVVASPQPATPAPMPSSSSMPSAQFSAPSSEATMVAGSLDNMEGGATVIAAAPRMPRATLIALETASSPAPKGPVLISPLPFVIGRTEGAYNIQNANISRKHAQITYDESQRAYFITDLNSSNGTSLNSQRLAPGQAARLTSGAVIGLGPNVTVRFDVG
jgi:VWFA-related protein